MQVFCFGDSITYGGANSWVGKLRKHMEETDKKRERDSLVYNLGVPGNTSRDVLERFEQEFEARPDSGKKVVIFQFGINDVTRLRESNQNRVRIEEFRQNLENLYAKARIKADEVIFLGFTPVIESKTTPLQDDNSQRIIFKDVRDYEDELHEFCRQKNVKFVELFDLFMENGYSELLEDGYHPNAEGQQLVFEGVRDELEKL